MSTDHPTSLKDIRAEWEKKQEVLLCVTHAPTGYREVLVVTVDGNNFRTFRYFPLGDDDWAVSMDYEGSDMQKALDIVTEFFKDNYPRE